jgi:hypothetical protein
MKSWIYLLLLAAQAISYFFLHLHLLQVELPPPLTVIPTCLLPLPLSGLELLPDPSLFQVETAAAPLLHARSGIRALPLQEQPVKVSITGTLPDDIVVIVVMLVSAVLLHLHPHPQTILVPKRRRRMMVMSRVMMVISI